jgi:hypothetical protein
MQFATVNRQISTVHLSTDKSLVVSLVSFLFNTRKGAEKLQVSLFSVSGFFHLIPKVYDLELSFRPFRHRSPSGARQTSLRVSL